MPFLVSRRKHLRSKSEIICVSIWGLFAALYKSPYKDLRQIWAMTSPKIFIASSAPQLSVLETASPYIVFLELFLVQNIPYSLIVVFIPMPKKFSDKTFHTKFCKKGSSSRCYKQIVHRKNCQRPSWGSNPRP